MALQGTQDGISAWIQYLELYDNNGSSEHCLNKLDEEMKQPFIPGRNGGFAIYIDTYQAIIQELRTIAPSEYSSSKCKRELLSTLETIPNIAHLIQHCRNSNLSFMDTTRFLRQNAHSVDRLTGTHPKTRSGTVLQHTHESPELTLEATNDLFDRMSNETSVVNTYNTFKSRTFHKTTHIPDSIWRKLEPDIKQKILKIKESLRERAPTASSKPLPGDPSTTQSPSPSPSPFGPQYPSMLKTNLTTNDFDQSMDSDTDEDILDATIDAFNTTTTEEETSNLLV